MPDEDKMPKGSIVTLAGDVGTDQGPNPRPSTSLQADRPLVTFAVFAYNQEKFIREAVEGAFAQTYEPLEIILSDDCSTDRTFEIMQEMAAAYEGPHNVTVMRNVINLGQYTFGRRVSDLLDTVRTSFVVLAAGDDISVPHRTDTIVGKWLDQGCPKRSYHSAYRIIESDGNTVCARQGSGEFFSSSTQIISQDGYGLLGATHAFSMDVYKTFGALLDRTMLEDGAIGFRAMLLDGVDFLDEILVYYRRHEENMAADWSRSPQEFLQRRIFGSMTTQFSFMSDLQKAKLPVDERKRLERRCRQRISRLKFFEWMQSKGAYLEAIAGLLFLERRSLRHRLSFARALILENKKNWSRG